MADMVHPATDIDDINELPSSSSWSFELLA
jgi:hypothetical protein